MKRVNEILAELILGIWSIPHGTLVFIIIIIIIIINNLFKVGNLHSLNTKLIQANKLIKILQKNLNTMNIYKCNKLIKIPKFK